MEKAINISAHSMTEKLLQFIWQFQYFNKTSFCTTNGEPVVIVHPGKFNIHQGPDFLDAQVRIGKTLLAGSIELHLQTSGWHQHGHHLDPNFRNVILHVVWNHDAENFHLPVVELQSRISHLLLEKYASLMGSPSQIPCSGSISEVKELIWKSWIDRMAVERLTRKAQYVISLQDQNEKYWEETFWWLLAKAFGSKVNGESFELVARSIPIRILSRHKNQIHQIEALLFGQAGLLNKNFKEDYPLLLKREYHFLAGKYHLKPVAAPIHFLRMRPSNFPTIRLAQLSMLLHQSKQIFAAMLESTDAAGASALFEITANDYWHYHYRFDEISSFSKKKTGTSLITGIMINTVIPVLYAYGLYNREESFCNKALRWLGELEAESNGVVKGFVDLNRNCHSALDSQAMLELKSQYCDNRLCLQCAVGNALLGLT